MIDRMHRHDRETFNADEYDIDKHLINNPDLLLGLLTRHLWRNISAYNALPEANAAKSEELRRGGASSEQRSCTRSNTRRGIT